MNNLETDHRPDFVLAHERYAGIRGIAFAETLRVARRVGLATEAAALRPITTQTIDAYRLQWGRSRRHWTGFGGWDWEMLFRRYCRKPRAFHTAVWAGDTLCGLCVGRVCRSRSHIMVPFMESSPDPGHPLRGTITPLVLDACRNYALAIGVERILLKNPLEGVQERYTRFGFRLACTRGGNVYFESRCTH
ncbi:MAG TPA: hypothetical protein VF541_04785 [Longimicrobium sp.]|jgi:hypothetical protein